MNEPIYKVSVEADEYGHLREVAYAVGSPGAIALHYGKLGSTYGGYKVYLQRLVINSSEMLPTVEKVTCYVDGIKYGEIKVEENSLIESKKEQALAKLTDEEKELLGLTDTNKMTTVYDSKTCHNGSGDFREACETQSEYFGRN